MKILIIDNQDSFTFNLKHYVQQFTNNVFVVRGDDCDLNHLRNYDKILISPGPGLPFEHPILKKVLDRYYDKKSILGVCLGQQAIADFFGARLENLRQVKHGVSSYITHSNNSVLFKNIPQSFKVGHYHSWVVSKNNFPQDLNITSENKEGIITSISHRYYDIHGVQFHPESILTEHGLQLIKNWLIS